jgi:hypothetical protein
MFLRLIITAIITVVLTGCVENLIHIRVFPNGSAAMHFTTKGDSTDVFDMDFPHPDDERFWTTSTTKEFSDDNWIWIQSTEGMLTDTVVGNTLMAHPQQLAHNLNLKKQSGWFTAKYFMDYQFDGRRVFQKYPRLGLEILNDFQGDSTEWLPEVLAHISQQAIKDLKSEASSIPERHKLDRLANHLANYFTHVQFKESFEELTEERNTLFERILQPLSNEFSKQFLDSLFKAMEPYDKELETTISLYDDQFRVSVLMPGYIQSTNADSTRNDTLLWTFGLEELINDNYSVQAISVIYFPEQYQKSILFVFIIIVLFSWLFFRKHRQKVQQNH